MRSNFPLQSMSAVLTMQKWHRELNEQTYRIHNLGEGYYAIACMNIQTMGGDYEITFEVTLVDCNFQAVGPIDVSTFPKPDVIVRFIEYKKKYLESVLAYCKTMKTFEVSTFDFTRDTEAEKEFNNHFAQHRVEPADPNSFKIQE